MSQTISATWDNEIKADARCRWLTPVILATQEAEARRIVVQRQIA
jgi:hypothetical protein